MTDFGVRGAAGGATEVKQDDIITASEAVQAAAEALTMEGKVVPVNAQVFNDTQAEYTSDPIDSEGFRHFLLRIILTVVGAPTTIKINVQFSQEGTTFENYVRGPFASLMYEDTAGTKNECIDGPIIGDRMRINVVAIGTTAGATFTLTCKLHGFR